MFQNLTLSMYLHNVMADLKSCACFVFGLYLDDYPTSD